MQAPTPVQNLRELLGGLARHALGEDALRGLRKGRWTLVSIAAPALGLVSDFCTILGPLSLLFLKISSVAFVVLAAAVLLRTRYCRHCAFPCVASLFLVISFGLIVIAQKAADATQRGVLVKAVPSLTDLQDQLASISARLGVIDDRTARIDDRTKAMAKDVADIKALAQQLLAINPGAVGPGAEKQVAEALQNVQQGASQGDERLQQALDLLKANRVQEALPLLRAFAEDKSAQINEDRKAAATAYRNLGAIAGLADPTRALEAYEKAADLDPADLESLNWAGSLEVDHGDFDKAEAHLKRVMSSTSGQPWIYYWAGLRLADIQMSRGDRAGALNAYRDGLASAESLAQSNPGNLEWQRDVSVSDSRIGDVLVAQGDRANALNAYRESLAIRQRLAHSDPGNAEWQRDLSISGDRIGDVLVAQGDRANALNAYRESLAIRQRLAHSDPGNAEWLRDLSISDDRMGDVLVAQGDRANALNAYRDSLAIRQRLAQSDPGNAEWQRDLSISDDRMGDVLVAQGDRAGALNAYRDSLAVRQRLARFDPGNAEWQRDLSISGDSIGDVLVAQGDRANALNAYRDSLAIRQRLAQSDPGNAEWQRDLSVSDDRVGNVLLAQGERTGALTVYRDSFAIRQRLAQSDPGNAGWQRDLSMSDEKIGDVLLAQGDRAGALNAYRDSLAIRQRLAQSDPGNAQWQLDVIRSNWKMASMGDDAHRRWTFIVVSVRALQAANKLDADQAKWLPIAEKQLAAHR
jgi:predicted negative regulator of RcsB-dependent stress response